MRKLTVFLLMLTSLVGFQATAQVPFTPGNLVVLRVGNGSAPLNDKSWAVFLDEYSPGGVLKQSIAMPTMPSGANHSFTLEGFLGDDGAETGMLNLSPNGQWLTAIGFDAPELVDNAPLYAVSVRKTLAVLDYNATINTTTSLTDAMGGQAFSVVTNNGTDLWCCLALGINYTTIGSSTSTNIISNSNYRALLISNNQLFASFRTGIVRAIGSGLSTTGPQIPTTLPGQTTQLGQCQFFFADINPAIPGDDVMYVAHTNFGIRKYSFDGATWINNGTIGVETGNQGTDDNYLGITGVANGTTVTLYATRKQVYTNAGGGELVTLTDASGYNGTLTGTPTVLATAPFQTRFAGVAFAPVSPSVKVSAKAFLQGAYNTSLSRHKDVTTAWANVLNANALTQPFNVAPFNYAGTEHVSAGFFTSTAGVNTDITDWVLLELRDATTPGTIISRQAALIREDGQIVDVDGVSPVPMTALTGVADGNYYIVIKHRNHLAVRSANPVALNGSTATLYDFTTAQSQAYQNPSVPGNAAMATKDLPGTETGKFLLWGGNANGDGFIRASGASNVSDYLTLLGPLCLQGDFSKIINSVYRKEDMNLDGVVRASAALNVNDYLTLLSTGILAGNTSNIITSH